MKTPRLAILKTSIGCILFICLLFGLNESAFSANYTRVKEHTLFNGEKLVEYKLNNGLQVLLLPRMQAKVLTYQIWFRVGSVDEKLDPKLRKTGLAHLFEHMMFRGTKKYPDGKFDELISKMGGTGQNATTFYYRTNYFESVPSKQLEQVIKLEADRMENLNLIDELLQKEKGAVVGELRRHLDSPRRIAYDELLRLMYNKATYRWNVIGTEKEIKGFTLEEAKYFYKTFYAPNNGTIIIVGHLEPEATIALVDKYYGHMKSQKIPPRNVPPEPKQKKERVLKRTHKQATSEILLMGYHIPPISSPDIVPLGLLATHLSVGMEARLRKLLVDKGIAVSANGSPGSQPDAFDFFVQMAENHKAEEAIKIIDAEIAKLQTEVISPESFERARNQELFDLYQGIGNNSRLARFLGEYLMMSGNYLKGFELLEGYKKLKPEEIRDAAKKYLVKSNRSVVIIRPEKKGAS